MEYGTAKIPQSDRSYGFFDLTVTWFGSGVNTGSWFFGGMAAAMGMGFVMQYSLLWLPLMMVPWAMVGWIAWKHGASTVTATMPGLGAKGARLAGIGEFFGMIGWPAVNTFIAAISLTYVFGQMWGWPTYGQPGAAWPMVLGILITAAVQGLVVISGSEAIKYLEWIAVVLLIILGIWETIVVLQHWDLAKIMAVRMPEATHSKAFYFDLAFGFCWGWAMIADFGRFARTSTGATVGSWLGVNLGQGWFMLIGAIGVIGVFLDTGVYDPNASDPSSIIASLGLGTVAFLVVFFATVSTNVTVLYGAAMGLVGATKTAKPRSYLRYIAVLQLVMCFVPLAFAQFIDFFTAFLHVIGGIFIPLWTIVVLDYFVVRKMRVSDEDLFAGENADGTTQSRLGDWNAAGLSSMVLGLVTFYALTYAFKDIAAVTTAGFPAIAVTGVSYLFLTLVAGMGRRARYA